MALNKMSILGVVCVLKNHLCQMSWPLLKQNVIVTSFLVNSNFFVTGPVHRTSYRKGHCLHQEKVPNQSIFDIKIGHLFSL